MRHLLRARQMAVLAALAAGSLGLGTAVPATATTSTVTLVPYLARGYRYHVVQHGLGAGFESATFDDSTFAAGTAAFGTGGYCPLDRTVATRWTPDTDLLVRRTVSVPAAAASVTVAVAIDNDIQVFWNGTPIGAGSHEGCAARDSLVFNVPSGVFTAGDNVLAIRAVDRGGEDYFDVSVVAAGPIAITASAESNGAPYAPGAWTAHDVVVTFTCSSVAGVAALTPPETVAGEGLDQSVTGTCTDRSDASTSATFGGIDVDKTPPSITYSPHPAGYDVDQTVDIACTASDALSGVAGDTCQDIIGPAYIFPLGADTFTATATDRAGNLGSGSTSFFVAVSERGLCALVRSFENQAGIAGSLCAKLAAAERAQARGDNRTAERELTAFANEVAAQDRKTLTDGQAALLARLGAAL